MKAGIVQSDGVGAGGIEWTVGEEGVPGGLIDEDLAVSEEVVDVVAFLKGDEEDLAFAGAPGGEEVGGSKEDGRSVGEGGAEEHGGGAGVDQGDGLVEGLGEV